MRRKSGLYILLFAGLLLVIGGVCFGSEKELIVSAAASLKESFEEIAKLFEQENKGVKVLLNFGGSGTLRAQIEGGAPVDVFASAGQPDMDILAKKGLLMEGTRKNFVANVVVLVVPMQSKLNIKSFADLKKDSVKHIAIAEPKLAPVGKYTLEILQHLHLWDSIKDKVVYPGDVRGVLDLVARNEVDAGFVYRTDAMTRPKEVKIVLEAPKGTYTRPLYPIAVLKNAPNPVLARKFVALVLSPAGQKILKKHGFQIPEEKKKGIKSQRRIKG